MKKLMLALIITTLMMSQQSCKKEDTTVTPSTPTTAFSLVGTWALSSTQVSFGTFYSPTPAEIAKSVFYNASDFVFTSDGKYTRGKDSGTWTYVSGTLKLGDLPYSISNDDMNTFTFGNSWIGFNTDKGSGINGNPTISEIDAISTAQSLMSVYSITIPKSSKDVSYKVTYKKK